MSAFVSWIMGILGVVILGTILDIFLSEKKLGKTIRSVIASLIVLMIISPIPALIGGLKSCTFEPNEVKLDENFLGYANRIKIERLQSGVEQAFADKGFKNVHVEISAEIDAEIKITAVRVDLRDLVLEGAGSNINKVERARDLATEFLKVGKEKIMVIE